MVLIYRLADQENCKRKKIINSFRTFRSTTLRLPCIAWAV